MVKPIQAVLVSLLVLAVARSGASTAPYPRVWNCQGQSGNGAPLIPGRDYHGTRDELAITNYSRFPLALLSISPWGNVRGVHRGDVIARIRANQPGIKLIAYTITQGWFHPPTLVPGPRDSTFYADWQNTFRATDLNPTSAWVYLLSPPHTADSTVLIHDFNWGNPVFQDSLTKLFIRAMRLTDSTGHAQFDGIFLDTYERRVSQYMNDNGPSWAWSHEGEPDLVRGGYASKAAMDTAFTHGLVATVNQIRAAMGPDFLIFANTGTHTDPYDLSAGYGVDGLVRELFLVSPTNDFSHARAFIQQVFPTYKLLKGELTVPSAPRGATSCKQARYILGTSCLGDGWAFLSADGAKDPMAYYDEYSVNEAGASDTTGKHVGWLGQPRGPARVTGGLWVREFDHGMVLVDSAFVSQSIDLGSSDFRSIQGVIDTTVNDGRAKRLVTVPGQDAVFLWKPSFGNDAR